MGFFISAMYLSEGGHVCTRPPVPVSIVYECLRCKEYQHFHCDDFNHVDVATTI